MLYINTFFVDGKWESRIYNDPELATYCKHVNGGTIRYFTNTVDSKVYVECVL